MTHNHKHYGPDARSDVSSTCRNCDEPTTHPWEVCNKCYRDPNTNTCSGCGKPMYVQYPCVCGNCINSGRDSLTEHTMPANTKQQQQSVVLKIEFSNRKAMAMEHFARWLSGSGEQEYWTWMECRELDEPDSENITATEFKYYGDLDYLPSDYSEFVGDDTIRTTRFVPHAVDWTSDTMTNELTSVGRCHQQHFSPIIMRLRQLLAQSTAIAYTKQAHRELRVLRVPEFDPADVFGENIDNTTQVVGLSQWHAIAQSKISF